jgi:hypothetical protein
MAGGIALARVPANAGTVSTTQPELGAAQVAGDAKAQQAQQHWGNATTALSNADSPITGQVGKSFDTTNSPEVFVNRAAEPVATDRHASAGTNTYLYMIGGEYYNGSTFAITSTVQRYDPAANTWSFVASMPGVFDNNEACTMNGKIYVPGGYAGSGPPFSNAHYIYDIATNIWTTGAAVPGVATLWAAVQCDASSNKVYVIGGYNGTTGTDVTKIYDVATNTWTTGTAMPGARYGQDSGLISGAIYAAGGSDGTNTVTTVYKYTIASNSWTIVVPMAIGGLYGSAGVYNGLLYISGGGFGSDASAYLTRTERYDPIANTWTTIDPLLTAVRHTNGGFAGNMFHAVGGASSSCPTVCNNNQQLTVPAGATSTPTRTRTPTRTPTVGCVPNYTITSSTGATVVPATTFVAGSNCDDCAQAIALPFPFSLYGQTFTMVNASSNGNLQFSSSDTTFTNTCLPAAMFNNSILPHWDDQLLTGAGQGIYTSITGTAPNRVFNIEWRGGYFSGSGTVNYEVRLFENSTTFEVIYGTVTQGGTSATVGVQRGTGASFTQFECNTAGTIAAGLKLTFTASGCTPTNTPEPSCTPFTFTDVHPSDYFYEAVQYLACLGAISGYSDGSFRPYNDTTRGQLCKIVVVAEGFPIDTTGGPHFSDVPATNAFYQYIETAYNHRIIAGYSDGTFRPQNNATRGQISVIIYRAITGP